MGWYETYDSRRWSVERSALRSTVDLKFILTGTEDDFVARLIVEASVPGTYAGLVFQQYDMEHVGNGIWNVEAQFGIADLQESTYNWDTTGSTVHIDQSLETVSRTSVNGGAAPDLKGLIGFDGETVRGTDVIVPRYAWNEQHIVAAERFTAEYRSTLFFLTGKTNASPFRGFKVGEVQFQGITASQRGFHAVEATYYFEASENLTNFAVGGITIPRKRGFEHVWVAHAKKEDGANHRVVKQVDAVYVERIFDAGDFATLGIGVTA